MLITDTLVAYTLALIAAWIQVIHGSELLPFQVIGSTGATTVSLLRNEPSFSDPVIDIPAPGLPYIDSGAALSAYVVDNGMITLNDVFPDAPQSQTGFDGLDSLGVVGIAPYWSDNDIRIDGQIRYEVLSEGSTSTGDEVLAEISQYITNHTLTNFTGNWMLLADWSLCPPFPHGETGGPPSPPGYTDLRNSYQAVLITDGVSQSYAVFIYQCDLIEWSGIDPVYARIGLTDGAGNTWLHDTSGTNGTAMVDCTNGPGTLYNILLDLVTFEPVVRLVPTSTVVSSSLGMTSTSTQVVFNSAMSTQSFSQSQVPSVTVSVMPTVTPTTTNMPPGPPVVAILVSVVVVLFVLAVLVICIIILLIWCVINREEIKTRWAQWKGRRVGQRV